MKYKIKTCVITNLHKAGANRTALHGIWEPFTKVAHERQVCHIYRYSTVLYFKIHSRKKHEDGDGCAYPDPYLRHALSASSIRNAVRLSSSTWTLQTRKLGGGGGGVEVE